MSILLCGCGEFTFYINYGTTTTQVYPLNFLETSLVWEPETGHVYYRQKFQGTLVFGGIKLKDDFDFFWDIEEIAPCARLYFKIYKDTFLYWEGYFSTSNGSWDLDECTFSVTPLVFDNYVDILDGADLQYNILDDLIGLPEVNVIYDNGVDAATTYTHNRMFYDTIEYLADKIIPGIIVDSTFFESVDNPVTLTTNKYNYLTIAQKSDIKNPLATNPATVGMISFNEIMEICRCMNLYWDYVDIYGTMTLRIEHISFWPENPGLDISTQKLTRGTNKYRYINESIPKYEKFSWMEANNQDFIGYPIWYNSDCVNQDPDTNSTELAISNVTTDLEYIINRVADVDDLGASISNDGWVILANELRGSDLYVWFGLNIYDVITAINQTLLYANIDMSWYSLHKCFWRHNRQLITGNINGSVETFYTARKVKQQECSIIYCDTEFDPSEYMTTELGETYFGGEKAKVSKASIKPYGQIDLVLLYGPEDNAITPIIYDKVCLITEVKTDTSWVFGSTWYGLLSEAAPIGGVSFQFKATIRDGAGGSCSTAFIDLSFVAGTYKSNSGEVAWCDPGGGPDYYIETISDITYTAGWLVRFKVNSI